MANQMRNTETSKCQAARCGCALRVAYVTSFAFRSDNEVVALASMQHIDCDNNFITQFNWKLSISASTLLGLLVYNKNL